MKTALDKARRKLVTRQIYFRVEWVKRQDGSEVGALVPLHPLDVRSMRERRFAVGQELAADLKQARNYIFWRKVHRVGAWLADNVDEFTGLTQHQAVKKMQELSGIGVSMVEYTIEGLGKLTRAEAEPLDFESMDEGRFNELYNGPDGHGGWVGWLRREILPHFDGEPLAKIERLLKRKQT